jgi:septal ring factor EnvC (AmiA/AmiB activator)
MNGEPKKGMNAEERECCRNELGESRKQLRLSKRAADDDDQRTQLQHRLDENERELAHINRIALSDRDDDPEVIAQIDALSGAVKDLTDETAAFERATDKARQIAGVIAKADQVLGIAARLITLVV